MNAQDPIVKDLVLIGGGHSHVAVLKRFGMKPVPGVRITVIGRDVHTPYSGMLPGYIAGHYQFDECHIDLRPLTSFAGARLYHSEVTGLDLTNKRVLCADRPPVPYDLLSINIGSRPNTLDVPGASKYAIPVKPINQFLNHWRRVVEEIVNNPRRFRIVVVGAGAGGVELTLAVQYGLRTMLTARGVDPDYIDMHLVSGSHDILPTHNRSVRQRFRRTLADRGVSVHVDSRVRCVEPNHIVCSDGNALDADAVLWVTQAGAASWLTAAGLDTDDGGFLRVNECLQSTSHREVFAAGDIAAVDKYPRPKSGVFAVRQGRPLADNLRRALLNRPLKSFRPQREFLSLISTGDRYAVASRGRFACEGAWVWRWKDWIDRRFMTRYSDLPEMETGGARRVEPGLAGPETLKEISSLAMRCGGCGAKVGSTVLNRVLQRLEPVQRDDILIGLNAPDDAAVATIGPDQVVVSTVDYFRAFIDDPYVFGRIAANHSLGDIFAMGAEPQSAMAVATLPYGLESQVEEQLYQLLAGAMEELRISSTALVGGHTSEGAELALGFAVNGVIERDRLMRKAGMRTGDCLVLTKPLGTGTLFAADMRNKAKGRWIDGALASMLVSNYEGARCLHRHGATACTDVTGFGLLGHLVEMTRASQVDVELELDELPVLDGALETVAMGIFSSLQPQNIRLRRAVRDLERSAEHQHFPLLFDPQTAGGLLASVPEANRRACLMELHGLGYPDARVIGRVRDQGEQVEPITLIGRAA